MEEFQREPKQYSPTTRRYPSPWLQLYNGLGWCGWRYPSQNKLHYHSRYLLHGGDGQLKVQGCAILGGRRVGHYKERHSRYEGLDGLRPQGSYGKTTAATKS